MVIKWIIRSIFGWVSSMIYAQLFISSQYLVGCYLYLPAINKELSVFQSSYNEHPLRTAQNKSPNQLWLLESVKYGVRGLQRSEGVLSSWNEANLLDTGPIDLETFGVGTDEEMEHETSIEESIYQDFTRGWVALDDPRCPLDLAQFENFGSALLEAPANVYDRWVFGRTALDAALLL